jgi:hypothetical protein
VTEWWAKRYHEGKAKAEVKVLENVGEERAQGFVKGILIFMFYQAVIMIVIIVFRWDCCSSM